MTDTWTPPAPTWATPPTPGARHQLPGLARTARLLGVPLMPWQRQVARVATELRADGRWRYRTVVVTVPRQSGKTTLVQALQVHRAITRPEPMAAYYTAQTGKDASAKWAELVERIDSTPLAGLLPKPRLSAGSQALLYLAQLASHAKAYAAAQVHKELREAMAQLPSEATADAWAQLRDWLAVEANTDHPEDFAP